MTLPTLTSQVDVEKLRSAWASYKTNPRKGDQFAREIRHGFAALTYRQTEILNRDRDATKASDGKILEAEFDRNLAAMEEIKRWVQEIDYNESPADSTKTPPGSRAAGFGSPAMDGPNAKIRRAVDTGLPDDMRAPGWDFSREQLDELREAGSRKGTKVVTAANAPHNPDYTPALSFLREPTRIADYIPTFSMGSGSVFYSRITTAASAAAFVAAGTLKPESSPSITRAEAVARKIAHWVDVEDEVFMDSEGFDAWIREEVIAGVIDQESNALLNGTGVAPQFAGVLNTPGILTLAKGTESSLETLFLGAQSLRTGASKVGPTMVAVHPTNYSTMRLQKAAGSGEYLAGDPSQDVVVPTLWGIPVVQTTQIAAGTALLGNWAMGAKLHLRQAPNVEIGRAGDGLKKNVMTVVAEERLALEVGRPTCFVAITGI